MLRVFFFPILLEDRKSIHCNHESAPVKVSLLLLPTHQHSLIVITTRAVFKLDQLVTRVPGNDGICRQPPRNKAPQPNLECMKRAAAARVSPAGGKVCLPQTKSVQGRRLVLMHSTQLICMQRRRRQRQRRRQRGMKACERAARGRRQRDQRQNERAATGRRRGRGFRVSRIGAEMWHADTEEDGERGGGVGTPSQDLQRRHEAAIRRLFYLFFSHAAMKEAKKRKYKWKHAAHCIHIKGILPVCPHTRTHTCTQPFIPDTHRK